MRKVLPWLLVVAWSGACTQREHDVVKMSPASRTDRSLPHDSAAAAQPIVPKVVFLGDSLSAGLHLPADEAFPAVVQRLLASRGQPIELLNAGVSGDTTAGGLRRVDWLLKQHPDVVVVELGANDGLRGQPAATVEANLSEIIRKIQASGARVLLLGMRLPPSHGASYVSAFEAIYPRVASERNVPLVPFFLEGVAGVPELNLADGIHPTAEGHRRVARNVLSALERVLHSATQAQATRP